MDNARRNIIFMPLLSLLVLSLVYCVELYDDILPDKINRNLSLFEDFTDLFSVKLNAAMSILLILYAGVLLYYIDSKYFLFKTGGNLLFPFWILQICGFSFLHTLTEAHFAVIFILLSHNTLFSVDHKSSHDYGKIFISSMYLGIATVFYSYSAYFLISNIIGLFRLKYPEFRDCVVSVSGFLTPFYFAIFVSFFSTGDWLYPVEKVVNNLTPKFPLASIEITISQYITVMFISALILIKWFTVSKRFGGINQKIIACDFIFSISLIVSALIFLFFAPDSKLIFMIMIVFSTSGLRILFIKIKKRFIANVLLVILILLPLLHLFE